MNKTQLIDVLSELAEKDLIEGCALEDHPCSVAIRAINQCFEDIRTLKRVYKNTSCSRKSKKVQMLVGVTYDPEW